MTKGGIGKTKAMFTYFFKGKLGLFGALMLANTNFSVAIIT